jgi:hypothetical protein
MVGLMTRHTWIPHMALRISSSSGSSLAPPKAPLCVLDLLGYLRNQPHLAMEATI